MQLTIFTTMLLACLFVVDAKHHRAASHSLNKRQAQTQLEAVFTGVGGVTGNIVASQSANGSGVVYAVQLHLPSNGGPFNYHVHVSPIDSSGNCTSAGGHLDPANVTETPPCNPSTPQICQAGDLSGKYGKINVTYAAFNITDPYTSLAPGVSNSISGRSIVIHASNGTRISCANLTSLNPTSGCYGCVPGNQANTSTPTGWTTWTPSATISPTIYGGEAEGHCRVRIAEVFVLAIGVAVGVWVL